MTRGCGSDVECRVATDMCKRKTYPYNKCHVTCCEHDYCNSSNRDSERINGAMLTICGFLLFSEIFLG